ncbi:unnamed protein product [Menidia menidia]|uniref:(Atlantic silverside) hypothetical protein n=1 Tax=Menidia menidia TaxID=238744 RepID=A0A8S4B7A7_9TELE|nr:unnamed protein product [Menidia menidia]
MDMLSVCLARERRKDLKKNIAPPVCLLPSHTLHQLWEECLDLMWCESMKAEELYQFECLEIPQEEVESVTVEIKVLLVCDIITPAGDRLDRVWECYEDSADREKLFDDGTSSNLRGKSDDDSGILNRLVSNSPIGAGGGGVGGGPDTYQPRFSSSLPTYLPVQCQLSGADSAFFLREANQEVMRNGSLSTRTEPFFLQQLEPGVAAPQPLPSVNCSYGNLSVEQPIPVELLQGPPPHLLLSTNQVTLNWRVKGQVVVPKVGSTRPWIQVLFYLIGRRWDEPDSPPPSLLPCVRAVAVRDTNEAAPSAGCRLMGPSGICVVRLEIPPAWFTPAQARKRLPEVTLPPVDVYYSILPVEGAGRECPSIVNEPWRASSANVGPLGGLGLGLSGQWSSLEDGGLQDMLKAGSVEMSVGPVSAKGERLQLDGNLEVLVPPSPVRLGKTVAFGIYMKSDSNMEQFTLSVSLTESVYQQQDPNVEEEQ